MGRILLLSKAKINKNDVVVDEAKEYMKERGYKYNDVFYTPINLVKKHLEIIKPFVKDKDIIFDPFYGEGAYHNLFKDYFKDNTFDYTEIQLKKD